MGDGEGLGVAAGDAVGVGDGEAAGLAVGDAVALGDGVAAGPGISVTISTAATATTARAARVRATTQRPPGYVIVPRQYQRSLSWGSGEIMRSISVSGLPGSFHVD